MSFKFIKKDKSIDVFIDDQLYTRVEKSDSHTPSFLWEAADGNYVINRMGDLSSDEFPSNFEVYDFYKSKNFSKLFFINLSKKAKELKVEYLITIEYKKWINPFTVPIFIKSYESKLIELGYIVKIIEEDVDSTISIEISSNIESQSITNSIENFAIFAKTLYEEVENKLTKKHSEKVITKIFDFPEGYQIVCSQYLLWFGELLSELGIKSNVSTQNREGKTFLTIAPENECYLKSDIEKYLYTYLSLPYSEYIPSSAVANNIEQKLAFQALQKQVNDYKQNIEIKNSLLELKSISNEKLATELRTVSKKLLLLESMRDSEIEIFKGALTIKEYELGPIRINPKKLVKLIKG